MDITPDKQNLRDVFSNKIFYIDFYQRQYKWNEEPVKELLDDIFFTFNLEYEKYKEVSIVEIKKTITKYSWYYLNTYVTNKTEGKIYIVDGQQRLTTLTLINICLYHLGKDIGIKPDIIDIDFISSCIATTTIDGKSFVINHEKEKGILEGLYKDKINDMNPTTKTGENIIENYKRIKLYIQKEIHGNESRFIAFVQYLFNRVVLIELSASQTDIPMLFEAINDRGMSLKPHEILKGKLLGKIAKDKVEKYNELWESQVEKLEKLYTRQIAGVDSFFEYYLRSKYVDNRTKAQEITKDNYHRKLFDKKEISQKLSLENEQQVIRFLDEDFLYYSNLWIKLFEYRNRDEYHNEFKHVYFNGLNEMESQLILILGACDYKDENENRKIQEISYHVDRTYSLLRLFQAYESNKFNPEVYKINERVRNGNVESVRNAFKESISNTLFTKYDQEIKDIFNASLFKSTGIDLEPNFKRYFFARIEDFIAIETNNPRPDFGHLTKTRKTKNNYQIEHILARNEENIEKFKDEEEFNLERNRLGALLLLKGNDNASSNNETYKNKLKTYASTLLWNETLTGDFYKSNKSFEDFKNRHNLNFKPYLEFGKKEVEERQSLLFEIVKIIWK